MLVCSAGSALAQSPNIFDTINLNRGKATIFINTRDSIWVQTVAGYDSTQNNFYPNGMGGGAIVPKWTNSHEGQYLMPDGNYYDYEILLKLFPSFRNENVLKQIQNKKK